MAKSFRDRKRSNCRRGYQLSNGVKVGLVQFTWGDWAVETPRYKGIVPATRYQRDLIAAIEAKADEFLAAAPDGQ
jgi:hypothetical protein